MERKHLSRRDFVKGSLSTFALASLPAHLAFGQTIRTRLEWQSFRTSPFFTPFVNAIRTMRANPDASDRRSWNYWVELHRTQCPHGVAYFLAWHRGFLFFLEQQLRAISGVDNLAVPYWDYYRNPRIPAEFTNASSSNPLYVPGRLSTDVFNALSLGPFSSQFTTFQRGTANSFEVQIEPRPHGRVHNLIGGSMASLLSPRDPIFWLHHSQIDRLWVAWVAANAGRQMPPSSSSYWSGSFTYGPGLTLPRNQLINTTSFLGYRYQNAALPTALPPQAMAARLTRVVDEGRSANPPTREFPSIEPQPAGEDARTIGGAREIPLGETSVSARIPIEASDSQALQSLSASRTAMPFGERSTQYKSVRVILDNVHVTPEGENGGYFFDVYLNLPERSGALITQDNHFIGIIGPFEISTARHHPDSARLVLPANEAIENLPLDELKELTVSFVRVTGNASPPKGLLIRIGELRIELSKEAPE